jgi:hypothetical protein
MPPFSQPTFSVSFPYVSGSAALRAPTPGYALPQVPSRDDVMAGLHDVYPAIAACAEGEHHMVVTTMYFASDGHVTSAEVPPGTFHAACILDAVSRARVPPFAQARFQVTYPFSI